MPGLGVTPYNTTRKPQGGVYDTGDIARVDVQDDKVIVEVVLTDPVQDRNTRSLGTSTQTTRTIAGTQTFGPTATRSIITPDISQGELGSAGTAPFARPRDQSAPFPDGTQPGEAIPNQGAGSPPPDRLISCVTPVQDTTVVFDSGGNTGGDPANTDADVNVGTNAAEESEPPRGSLFFTPLCNTCCHSPTDSPLQYYNLCLLVSTDPNITTMVENGMLEQVYGALPAIEEKYRVGDPGATLQEVSFLDFTNQQLNALISSDLFTDLNYTIQMLIDTGDSGIFSRQLITTTEMQVYQFKGTYDFPIPKDCQHLTIFTYITLDTVAFNQYLNDSALNPLLANVNNPSPSVYHGPIKELKVIENSSVQTEASAYVEPSSARVVSTSVRRRTDGSYETYDPTSRRRSMRLAKVKLPIGNIRSSKIYNKIIKNCSLSIIQALQQQNNIQQPKIENKFWLSKQPGSKNVLFMLYNHEQLIMQNCFIKNLRSKEVYKQQEFQTVEVEKVDLLDEDNTKIINRTVGIRTANSSTIKDSAFLNTKIEPDQETIGPKGAPVVLSKITEIPNFGSATKFVQLVDTSTSSGKFAYKFSFRFKDPSIILLKNLTQEFTRRVDSVSETYAMLEQNREDFKKRTRKFSTLIGRLVDVAKAAIAKANQILNILPITDYNPTVFINYMTCLANPKTSSKDHDDFILILRTLEQTLMDILSSAGVMVDGASQIGTTTTNQRSANAKQKAFVSVELQSQAFELGGGIGIDFMASSNSQLKQPQRDAVYSTSYLASRGQEEFEKFWNEESLSSLTLNPAVIREKASFFLTPSRIYGADEEIDTNFIAAFDSVFETKVKKIKLSKNKKPTKTSNFTTLLESLDNLPASFQLVSSDFEFSDIETSLNTSKTLANDYLQNQSNFSQNNIDTTKNKSKQVAEVDSLSEKILSSIESTFSEGFDRVSDNTLQNKINNNTTLEQVVDSSEITSLPPSLQAYKLRNSNASKMSAFVANNGLLSEPSNQIYYKNYFGLIYKIQYAKFSPIRLGGLEWLDLDSRTISNSKNLFCRIVPVSNINLHLTENVGEMDVFNEYFVVQGSSRNIQTSEITPTPMMTTRNINKSESVIARRIQSIMNQKTTYDSGSPVAYTNIIF